MRVAASVLDSAEQQRRAVSKPRCAGVEHGVRPDTASQPRSESDCARADGRGSRTVQTHVMMLPAVPAPMQACTSSALDGPHLVQGEQERERRFGALVLIRPIDVQPVATAAGRWVVEPVLQMVLPEEPVERPPRVCWPTGCRRSRGRRPDTQTPSRRPRPAAGRRPLATRRVRRTRSIRSRRTACRTTIARTRATRANASRPRSCPADASGHRR